MKNEEVVRRVLLVAKLVVVLEILYGFLILAPPLIPEIFNSIFGDLILSQHKAEIIGNETNSSVIAQKLMNWVQNSTKRFNDQKVYFGGYDWGIINVSNTPTLVIRTTKASWFIFTGLGNCKEDAWYFAELMNRSGFYSRVINVQSGAHAWAEFYDNGKKIIVDPSSNRSITNTFEFADQEWTDIEAIDLAGNMENVTREYILALNQTS
jgi:hypothetical protein